MKLAEYEAEERIFIDANIFIFHANDDATFGDSCTAFLNRIEEGEILGVVTPAVVDEVLFKILIGEATKEIGKASLWEVRKRMKDKSFSKKAYTKVKTYWEYVQDLHATGLDILAIDDNILEESVRIGEVYGLLTTDSIHVATCISNKISNIASGDADFKRIKELNVFVP